MRHIATQNTKETHQGRAPVDEVLFSFLGPTVSQNMNVIPNFGSFVHQRGLIMRAKVIQNQTPQ
jgi:hypothetical protein